MRISAKIAASAVLATSLLAGAMPASAACTRLAFSVNDYGKDGPTNDAKGLLDKYIVKWAGEHNIPKYNTGPKVVNCELFLNFIVFDEHTCRAEATVCWDGAPVAPSATSASAGEKVEGAPAKRSATAAVAKPKAAPEAAASTAIETGTLPVAAKPVAPAVAAPSPAPVLAATPAPSFVAPAAVAAARVAAPLPAAAAVPVADQVLAAATRAAAAAERAAAAAERAAAAATAAERAAAKQ